ncbi:uncharacterized protein MELLADRAFT_107449 [Melampsora larici-populina 98AG31]|uniref:Chromo domain-containing protein n=1 Tax=Melampsora larici-populina (strain 98AG31 / pathotype 3-4-7) TaxID=747676 RepID=F4RPU9_MELLP|nr:uncharacterized protein MELLADRAFT_107449 [Melampsora larici-populina 98AG31]EGG05675.1 hypothetical protein MELLADRAFT_107449 [Melampsora larici-populina 98AG31]
MTEYSSSLTSSEEDNDSESSSEHPLNEVQEPLNEADQEWEVAYIEGTEIKDDRRRYLIKYRGYSPSEWQDETAVEHSELLVEAFWRSLKRPGTQRSDWIAEQIKAVEEAPEEEEEEPEQQPEASTSKVQEGLIIKEVPIKKKKKKKKKKPKENREEPINSDLADSSSSSSVSSTSSISSSEESNQDSEEVEFNSKYIPKNLEFRKLMEKYRQERKQIKLEERKSKLNDEQIIQHIYFKNDFNHKECSKSLSINQVKVQVENHQQIESSNTVQINQVENHQRKDKGKGKEKEKVNVNGNGNGRKRKRDKGKGKENGTTKGTEKGKERAREDEETEENQTMKENQVIEEEQEEEESEDALEVTNKRLKKMTIPGSNSLKKLLRIPSRN